VTITGVTGIAAKTGTWTITSSGGVVTMTADGPASAELLGACGTTLVDVPEGKTVTITYDGSDAVVTFA